METFDKDVNSTSRDQLNDWINWCKEPRWKLYGEIRLLEVDLILRMIFFYTQLNRRNPMASSLWYLGGRSDCSASASQSVADRHQLTSDPDRTSFRSQNGIAAPQLLIEFGPCECHFFLAEFWGERGTDPPDHRLRSSPNSTLFKDQRLSISLLLFR